MALSFSGGSALPAQGTAAYNAAASAPSGSGSYNASTGVLSSGGSVIYSPTSNATVPTTPTTINGTNTAPAQPIPLATAPTPPNLMGTIVGNNAGLANNGLTYNNGLLTPQQQVEQEKKQGFDAALAALKAPINQESIYNSIPEKAQRDQAQQDVNNYAGQINTITAKAQADQLSLTGQGRGVPEVIIGGQQAQVAKEAAIKVLPIQAQLAYAQGNLALAQQHLDTVFQMKVQDAQSQNDFYNKQVMLAYDFFDKAEQSKLDTISKTNDQNFSLLRDGITFARNLASDALKNGQPGLAAQITTAAGNAQLDATSPTFARDLANFNSSIGTYQAQFQAPSNSVETQVIDVNGVKQLINSKTGEVIKAYGADSGSSGTQAKAIIKSNVDTIDGLLADKYLNTTVGPNFLSRIDVRNPFTGGKDNFIAGVEQVRGELTLDNLVNAKARGATFGALSEGELSLLRNSASKLGTWAVTDSSGKVVGYKANPAAFKAELQKINNFTKLDYVLKGGNPSDVGATTMPDGTVWVKNGDGTFTQLK